MSNEAIRIGIIGCGQIAQQHMKTYSAIPGAKMVACADLNETAARQSSETYGIEHVYTNFHEMLQRDDLDAIDVCLHNNFHMAATVIALEKGFHVYCEKPMAGSYRDALTMYETARATGKNLHIQLSTLYSDETTAAKYLIDNGELGPVYHARSAGHRRRGRPFVDGYGTPTFVQKRNSAGGALYDMGVYHISRMLYLLGNPNVERISGKTYQRTGMDEGRRAESGYDVEELGLGFVRFENELTLDIIESWAIHVDHFDGSMIVGDKGGVRLNPFGFFRSVGDLDFDSTANLGSARYRWDKLRNHGELYGSSQAHWIAALQGKVALLPTALIALNTMLISEGIYLSNSRGAEVTAEEVSGSSLSTAIAL